MTQRTRLGRPLLLLALLFAGVGLILHVGCNLAPLALQDPVIKPQAPNEGIDVMIFLWLSLVALIFGVLGFLLHAFYFSKQEFVEDSMTHLIQSMNRKLAVRERINADAQEEITKTRMLVKSLEAQLEQREEQRKALQGMAQPHQEDIRLLQKTADEMRRAAPPIDERRTAVPASGVAASIRAKREPIVPLWKDNLNSILNMLDQLQKDTKE